MSSRRHIPALDGLRGLAILLVFVFHYGGGSSSQNILLRAFGLLRLSMWIGVPLFFVLSGFLITGILWASLDDAHWWRNFYTRRSLRIFPLYYFSLLLVALGALLFGDIRLCLHRLWIFLLYLQNFPFATLHHDLGSPLPTDIYWSLAVEEHYYLFWPFLLRLARSREQAKFFCLLIFVLSFCFRLYGSQPSHEIAGIPFSTPARVGELAVGSWLALVAQGPDQEWRRAVRWAAPAAVIFAAGFVLVSWLTGYPAPVTPAAITWEIAFAGLFFGALLCLAMERGSLIERCAETAWLRWFGKISYGIYIYHSIVRPLAADLALRLAGNSHNLRLGVQFLIGAALSVAAALVSFYLLEQPILRLKARLTRAHYAPPPQGAVVE